MRRVVILFVILSLATGAFGQASDSQRTVAQAGQSKKPPEISQSDWAAVRRFLLDGIVSDFRKASAKTGHDYDDQRRPKAAAACVDWPHANDDSMPALLYWGDEWTNSDKDTPQSIRQSALKECEKAKEEGQNSEWGKLGLRVPCNCQMLLQDSQPVMNVPEEP